MTRELKKMLFKDIFPLYVNKVERKGHTKQELIDMLNWLCGDDAWRIVTGTICNVKIQDIEDEMIQDIRIMDKLVDDIAKGKKKQIWKS